MSEFQLKNIYNRDYIKLFSDELTEIYPDFDKNKFRRLVFAKGWDLLELKQRMRHITGCLHQLLPEDFKSSSKILCDYAKAHQKKTGKDSQSFELMFLPDFIEIYGIDHYKISVKAIEIITKTTSAEFAVRPFIEKYPDKMLAQMMKWTGHKNYWVRRLASEGCRPRLPWGMALKALKNDPTPILPILEELINDAAETVRRSVANNLNDISKDHPKTVYQISKKHLGQNKLKDRLIKHACRGLLKKGDTKILRLFGFGDPVTVEISELKMAPAKMKIGDSGYLSFKIVSKAKTEKKLRLEFAVYYVKSNGTLSKKVFQISEKPFKSGQAEHIKRKQRFTDFTTRKHHPGVHKLAIIVNGIEKAKINFELTL